LKKPLFVILKGVKKLVCKMETQLGSIYISQNAIARIAGSLANKCYGVVGMTYKNTADGIVSLLKGDKITKGIKVTLDDNKLVLDMHIMVEYGVNINAVCESISSSVKYQLKEMTGFEVSAVNIYVDSIRVND